MHGAGNDYIYVDTTQYPISHPEELARAWSAPHTGIGSDGLVLIGSSDKADFSMRIFNADGSEVEIEDEDEPAPNGNGHSDEQVLNETIPLVLDEDEEAGDAEDEE